MPVSRRGMPEARQRDEGNVCENGVDRGGQRVPRDGRVPGTRNACAAPSEASPCICAPRAPVSRTLSPTTAKPLNLVEYVPDEEWTARGHAAIVPRRGSMNLEV